MSAVLAREIIPNLYENDDIALGKEDLVDDLNYDVYNLMACNVHTLPETDDMEELFQRTTQRAAQLLLKRLMDCETENSDVGQLIRLPKESSIHPRGTKLEEAKPETNWEKFAKEKGIKNKKRERMVFDEDAQEFRPRFGYKRVKGGIEDMPIVEVKAGQDPFADPWAAARDDKKQRVDKNLKNQERNKLKALGKKGLKKFDPVGTPGIPLDIKDRKAKRGKEGVRKALQLVQHSTASIGRFDDKRDGEPDRKIKGKKRSFRDNISSTVSDKHAMKSQLRIVEDKVDKKAKGVTNSLAAYEGILPDAPSNTFRQKKGKGKVKTSKK